MVSAACFYINELSGKLCQLLGLNEVGKCDKGKSYANKTEKYPILIASNKQGHTLNNWVEGASAEAYYPWESPKISTKIGQPYICQQTKESFDL